MIVFPSRSLRPRRPRWIPSPRLPPLRGEESSGNSLECSTTKTVRISRLDVAKQFLIRFGARIDVPISLKVPRGCTPHHVLLVATGASAAAIRAVHISPLDGSMAVHVCSPAGVAAGQPPKLICELSAAEFTSARQLLSVPILQVRSPHRTVRWPRCYSTWVASAAGVGLWAL